MNALASGPGLSGSKQRLLVEAERAFGLHGIAGASLREIAERAGHRNRTAVQYHFGDRDGLVLVILRRRRPQIDVIRRRFFDTLGMDPAAAPPELLVEAVIGPLLFSAARIELHDYARTVYALLHYDIDGRIWQKTAEAAPITSEIYSALRRHAQPMGDAEWRMRQLAFGRCCVDITANREIMFPGDALSDTTVVQQLTAMLSAMLVPCPRDDSQTGREGTGIRTNCAIWQTIGYVGNIVI